MWTGSESFGESFDIQEDGWPCQRLRVAFGAFLFVIFEVTIGRQLPPILTFAILAMGAGMMVSAQLAIRDFRLKAETRVLKDAIEQKKKR